MSEVLKATLGNQNRLQEVLGCSRTQAWRIWNGKSALTTINEKYIWRVLADENH